jgi:hypothetical protein
MSIEEIRSQAVEYRVKGSLRSPVLTARPGEVHTGLCSLENLAQVEEFIEALRKAAKVANLPDGSDEAKSA